MERRGSIPGAVFVASWAVPLLAGGLAGLADALLAWAQGRAAEPGPGLFVLGASLGALLTWGALLPFTVVLALLRRPLRPVARLAGTMALVILSPLGLVVGRALYKRIPWGPGDVAFGLAAGLGILLLAAAGGALLSRALAPRERGLVRALSRAGLPALLLLLPAAWQLGGAVRPPVPERAGPATGHPVLLLSIDTLRADSMGFTGNPRARTPWLDRLARRGTTYPECLAPSPWTLPSLGTLLTGSYPGQHLVLQELSGLSPAVTSAAEVAHESGYRTAAFVSNPWLATGSLARGFDTFDVAERLESLGAARGTRLYDALAKVALRGLALDRADRLTARAAAWVRNGDGAWLLWVHWFDPHLPNWPGAPWDRLFGPAPTHVGSALTVEEIRAGEFAGGEAGRREIEDLYDAEVALTDASVGDLLRALEESGELAEASVAFTADHGEEFWEHAGYGHGHAMYDEVVRVPLVTVPPGGAAGRVEPSLVRLVDLAPTVLAAAGFPPGDRFPGVDLAAHPDGVPETYGEATLYGNELKFLRTPRWKLVWDPLTPPEHARLYDVVADPAESENLAASRPEVADSLFGALEGWIERVGSAGAMAGRDLPEGLDPSIRDQLEALGYTGQ